jgi:hypothetical protein
MIAVNLNNPIEIRNAGMQALEKTLGRVGMVKFIQQFETGYGNYTAEKNDAVDLTLDEIDNLLKS